MAGTQHHRSIPDRRTKYLMILALIGGLIYLINRWLIIPMDASPAFFRNHLGDFLALPVYLPLSALLAIRLGIIPADFRLDIHHILAGVLIFSLIFEVILPSFDSSLTRDFLDTLAYLAGGMVVYVVGAIQSDLKGSSPPDEHTNSAAS